MKKFITKYFSESKRIDSSFYAQLMQFHLRNTTKGLFWNKYSLWQKVISGTVFIGLLALSELYPLYILICKPHELLTNTGYVIIIMVAAALLIVLFRPLYVKTRYHYNKSVYSKCYMQDCEDKKFDDVSDNEIREVLFIKFCRKNNIIKDKGRIDKETLKEMKEIIEHYRERNTYTPQIVPQFIWMFFSAITAVSLTSGVSWLDINTTNTYSFGSIVIAIIIMIGGFCIMLEPFVSGVEKGWRLSNKRQYHITLEIIERLIIESKD